MIDAGIFEGDLVIVERGKIAKEGDIVIAQIDEQWTMKYYRCKAGKIYLAPANKNYPPLFPENSLSIVAIVKAVVRKYSN
jgi:repressor LexA